MPWIMRLFTLQLASSASDAPSVRMTFTNRMQPPEDVTRSGSAGEGTASRVLDAADRLIGDLADAAAPLRAVSDALARLADGLGVEKVIVAVDDARLGRQVF